MAEIVLVYTTWPDAATAEAAGAEAVAERLAACANIGQPIESIYRWKGAVERAGEVPMLLKTTAAAASGLRAFLTGRHPYETPGIVSWRADEGGSHSPFLDWIAESVAAPPDED
jgi:periplasmic divalent cation tolerance protein